LKALLPVAHILLTTQERRLCLVTVRALRVIEDILVGVLVLNIDKIIVKDDAELIHRRLVFMLNCVKDLVGLPLAASIEVELRKNEQILIGVATAFGSLFR